MTNWDQLDAMGDIARLNQAKAIAQQQAQRDAQLAAQNAEVVRLLKEQKEREEAEKARLQAMPKCPDCLQPVELGSRRCPHCRVDIVSHAFGFEPYADRLTCRLVDASTLLQQRCDTLTRDVAQLKSQCLAATAVCNEAWRKYALTAVRALQATLASFNEDAQKTIRSLLKKVSMNERALTPQNEEAIQESLWFVNLDYPLERLKQLEDQAYVQLPRATLYQWTVVAVLVWGVVAVYALMSPADRWQEKQSTVLRGSFWLTMVCVGLGAANVFRRRLAQRDRHVAHEQAHAFHDGRNAALAACEAKSQQLDAAWRQKLNEKNILSKYRAFDACVKKARLAREQVMESLHRLHMALFALAETLDLGSNVTVELSSPLGKNGAAIRQMVQQSLRPPTANFTMIEVSAGEARDVEKTFSTFEAFKTALEKLAV